MHYNETLVTCLTTLLRSTTVYFIIERESNNTCRETRSNILAKTNLSRLVRI